ncbi:protein TIFY 9-like [Carex rostrata]
MEKEKHTTGTAGCYQNMSRPRPPIERNFTFPATSSGPPFATPCENPGPPLTIFFNGTVGIFHLPADQAEHIMEMAERASNGEGLMANNGNSSQEELLAKLREDLPIAKKRSLQIFLEKRKERLNAAGP